jgi:hypothetical protein
MDPLTPPDSAPPFERRFCYGMATETAVRESVAAQGDNGTYDMPYMRALLGLLEGNGHDVNDIRRELDRMASIVYASRDDLYPKAAALGRSSGRS